MYVKYSAPRGTMLHRARRSVDAFAVKGFYRRYAAFSAGDGKS